MTDNRKLCLIHIVNYVLIAVYLLTGMFAWWHFVAIFIALFFYLNIGIICGYHRYFTHASFKANRFVKLLMLYFGTLSSVGAVIGWVAVHRKHHRFSDTDQDPHSPFHKGNLRVWFGYFFNIYEVEGKYGARLAKDKDILFFQEYYYSIIFLSLIVLVAINPLLLIVLYSIPQILTLNATSAINVLTHITGEVKDSPTLGALIYGEGWHATHHKHPLLPRLHKYDIAGLTIQYLLAEKNYEIRQN